MSRARLLAIAGSAVLGVVCGVIGGVAFDRSASFYDPLALGIPLVDQPCASGDALLVVDTGERAIGLSPSVAEFPDSHYLRSSRSCETVWRNGGRRTPTYVMYLGPYTRERACSLRMTAEHSGDLVTMLRRGDSDPVPCLCVVSYAQMPILRSGESPSTLATIYIYALQDLLIKMGRRADPSNGVYDVQTVDEVRQFQADNALATSGGMNAATWKKAQSQGCNLY